ncbi:hypothetical protein Tco_0908970 [Tanacetum coccineum]|uniref:Uncharacterized protein n=1 Tax=Tanacetum coccineum TaxID=301880 RepID=A0ABQ5CNN1_9ASTR
MEYDNDLSPQNTIQSKRPRHDDHNQPTSKLSNPMQLQLLLARMEAAASGDTSDHTTDHLLSEKMKLSPEDEDEEESETDSSGTESLNSDTYDDCEKPATSSIYLGIRDSSLTHRLDKRSEVAEFSGLQSSRRLTYGNEKEEVKAVGGSALGSDSLAYLRMLRDEDLDKAKATMNLIKETQEYTREKYAFIAKVKINCKSWDGVWAQVGGAISSFEVVKTRLSAKPGGIIVISSQRVINTPMIIPRNRQLSAAGSTNHNVPRQLLEPSKPEPRIPNLVPATMNGTSYPIIIWPRVTGAVAGATTGQRWSTAAVNGSGQ